MEQLKSMKMCLISAAQAQMSNLQQVDTKELGEVIDMIKDLEEAIYYCTITKAMEESEENKKHEKETYYYTEKIKDPWSDNGSYYDPYSRDMDRKYGRMYYDGNGNSSSGMSNNGSSSNGNSGGNNARGGGTRGYQEREYMMPERDYREGRSPMSRRNYMESKEMHKDKVSSMKDLEHYMRELSEDITEMINDASTEEKQLLQKKLNVLAQKVVD